MLKLRLELIRLRNLCLLSLALIHLNVQGAKRRARRRERERRRVGNNPVASTAYLGVREQEQQYVIPSFRGSRVLLRDIKLEYSDYDSSLVIST